MINHARCLLANLSPVDASTGEYLAEELVDPAFIPLTLSTELALLRGLLLGGKPDRHMVNYRCRQLLTLVHASPLLPYVPALDPRLTYAVGGDDESLVPGTAFTPVATTTGATPALAIGGNPLPPDASGQMAFQYLVQIETATTLSVRQDNPFQKVVFDFVLTDGLSNFVALGDSGYTCAVTTATPDSFWEVTVKNRPQWDPGQLAANLSLAGEAVFDYVFGPDLVEPWATFRTAWEQSPDLPARLAGLLLGVIYRTEQIRLGG